MVRTTRRVPALVALIALIAAVLYALAPPSAAAPGDTVAISDVSETEGDSGTKTFTFTVTLSGTEGGATVAWQTQDGTAREADDDYETGVGQLTFAPGDTEETLQVTVNGDQAAEPDETFNVVLTPLVGAACGDCTGVGTIQNDDGPAPTLTVNNVAPDENSGNATFTVTLWPTSQKTVTVDYATADGTAMAGSDYTSDSGTLTFAPGESAKPVTVPITNDSANEPNENFFLNLSNPNNAAIGDGQGEGTILDDDNPPVLSIDDQTVAEGDSGTSNATFTVTLTPASGKTVTVTYATADGTATAGSDYTARSGTLTFAPGETTKTIDVPIVGDTRDENNETFKVTLSAPTNATISSTDGEGTGTINDDDGEPALAINDVSVEEGDSGSKNARFTVTLSSESAKTITVDYTTNNGTATSGSDYTTTSGTLTFSPGETSKTIDVPVLGDTLDEADEKFTVTLSNASNATIADASGEGTIVDNDAQPSLSINDANVTEGNSPNTTKATFTVTLNPVSGRTVTVDYVTNDGTADAGSDYTATGGTLTFAPGETSKTIDVTVQGDDVNESDETFTVNLSNPSNATIADGEGAGTITDDDLGPELIISDDAVVEGNSGTVTATFTVTLTPSSGQTVTVDYATKDGSATAPEDYTATSGTLTFSAGETTKTINVTVKGDTLPEGDETFTVVLTNATGDASIEDDTGIGTISDDGDGVAPALSINDPSVTEGTGGTTNLTFTVTRTGDTTGEVKADYTTSNGTATAPADYTAKSGTITIPAGETTATIDIAVNPDSMDEGDETLTVTLSNPRNATIADGSGTGTITDDDNPPTISIADAAPVTEGNSGTSSAVFTVSLSNPSSQTITVDYATAGGTATSGEDYTAANGTVTFAPGETSKSVNVTVVGDSIHEGDETFTVNLSNPSAAAASIADGTATGTITDDDPAPLLSISDVTVTEGNTGTINAVFTVTLTGETAATVTVDWATANGTAVAGSDYVAGSGTVTFNPGETAKTITVVVNGDTLDEANETFTVNLSNPSNATVDDGSGTGTITDDDPSPSLSIDDVAVTEGNSGTVNAVFTVTLSAASGRTVTVDFATANGTAIEPGDYTATNGTLTFNPGETSKTVTVAVKGDTTDEANETFTVGLSNASNATIADNSGTGTITDDDDAPSVSIADTAVTEGDSGTANAVFTVTLSAASGQTVTVDFATADGTAKAGSDYTAATGTVTFNPGETSKTVTVAVNGDTVAEGNETFTVTLSNPSNVVVADGAATGTITNDDPVSGYWMVAADGGVFAFGDAGFYGSTGNIKLNKPVVGMTPTASGQGYWFVASDGGIFNYGDAGFFGSTGDLELNQPIVGMEVTKTGKGYWLVARDGGMFAFGDAKFHGSAADLKLKDPIVGMARTPSGNGYWLVDARGRIFVFGDAKFYGGPGDQNLAAPIVDIEPTKSGEGYWLVAGDGGVFNYGDAKFFGSTGDIKLNEPIVGMTATASGNGYWFVASDGGLFNYGDARFHGSMGGTKLNQPVVGMAALK